jgi:CheY-like chemotaxis protein
MSYTILVIDDTKKILDIIKHFLEGAGYSVIATTSPTEGLKLAREKEIDLIILDIMMPEMDGYQVYEGLKKEERTKEIPVVMLTAKAVIMITPKDFFYGLYGFLAKPFTKAQLLGTVKNVLSLTSAAKTTKLIQPVENETDSKDS